MKYENAKDILPQSLLEEVQKYAEGKAIYIPKRTQTMGWGEASGCRKKLNKRNATICARYSAGKSVNELAEEFFLSPETIKKIVYGKKKEIPPYSPTITSAGQYSNAGLSEEWVRIYLESLGETMPDNEQYFLYDLARIPLRLIEKQTDSYPEDDGQSISGVDVPLIVIFENHKFNVEYQTQYLDYLLNQKINAHYAFVFGRNEEYNYFYNNFGKYFRR